MHLFVVSFLGWHKSEQHEIIQYLREANRLLNEPLRTARIRFTADQRRRPAGLGAPLGRRPDWAATTPSVVIPNTATSTLAERMLVFI